METEQRPLEMSQILQEGQVIELAGNADHQLAYEALSQLAAGGQAGPGHTIVIQGRKCLPYSA